MHTNGREKDQRIATRDDGDFVVSQVTQVKKQGGHENPPYSCPFVVELMHGACPAVRIETSFGVAF